MACCPPGARRRGGILPVPYIPTPGVPVLQLQLSVSESRREDKWGKEGKKEDEKRQKKKEKKGKTGAVEFSS